MAAWTITFSVYQEVGCSYHSFARLKAADEFVVRG